jgi:hypothetical protein
MVALLAAKLGLSMLPPLLLALLLLPAAAHAALSFDPLFQDGALLQRGAGTKIWGAGGSATTELAVTIVSPTGAILARAETTPTASKSCLTHKSPIIDP